MKRHLSRAIVALCALALCAPVALASDHDEVGPIYKHANQTAICTMRCDDGPCDFRIKIYDENGNVLVNQLFTNVPNEGSRMVVYDGIKRLLSCQATNNTDGDAEDAAFTLLSPTGKVVAITSQDN